MHGSRRRSSSATRSAARSRASTRRFTPRPESSESRRRSGSIAPPYRELLRPAETASPDVVLRYHADLLANAPDPADVEWLTERLPASQVVVWPVEHHFPHLARPALFVQLLAEVRRVVDYSGSGARAA